jgi:hypothetical protein
VSGRRKRIAQGAWNTTPEARGRAADERRRQHARQAGDEEDLRRCCRQMESTVETAAGWTRVLPTSGANRIAATADHRSRRPSARTAAG